VQSQRGDDLNKLTQASNLSLETTDINMFLSEWVTAGSKEIPDGASIFSPVGNIRRLRVALVPMFQNEACNAGA